MFLKLKPLSDAFKKELKVYKLVLIDSRTPRISKIFLGLAIGYLAMPFDLIPDFIPVLGQLDDILIVPGLVWLALKFIPKVVLNNCRRRAFEEF